MYSSPQTYKHCHIEVSTQIYSSTFMCDWSSNFSAWNNTHEKWLNNRPVHSFPAPTLNGWIYQAVRDPEISTISQGWETQRCQVLDVIKTTIKNGNVAQLCNNRYTDMLWTLNFHKHNPLVTWTASLLWLHGHFPQPCIVSGVKRLSNHSKHLTEGLFQSEFYLC